MNPITTRAHLPQVQFAPRAYMGCGGWDLARAPETAAMSIDESPRRVPVSSISRPRRTIGCANVAYESPEEEKNLSCGGGGYAPEFMKDREEEGPIVTLQPGLSGRRRLPRVSMGCGDELCEECKAKQEAGMGCTKCKRIRKRAMMNQELEGSNMGQGSSYDLPALVTSGLVVFGLFYLATR